MDWNEGYANVDFKGWVRQGVEEISLGLGLLWQELFDSGL